MYGAAEDKAGLRSPPKPITGPRSGPHARAVGVQLPIRPTIRPSASPSSGPVRGMPDFSRRAPMSSASTAGGESPPSPRASCTQRLRGGQYRSTTAPPMAGSREASASSHHRRRRSGAHGVTSSTSDAARPSSTWIPADPERLHDRSGRSVSSLDELQRFGPQARARAGGSGGFVPGVRARSVADVRRRAEGFRHAVFDGPIRWRHSTLRRRTRCAHAGACRGSAARARAEVIQHVPPPARHDIGFSLKDNSLS